MSGRRLPVRWTGVLAAGAIVLAPTAATLLAPSGTLPPAPPMGTAAWRADPSRLPDPVHADPVAVHDFLTTASEAERGTLVAEYPGVLGNLDGAPVALRYAANQAAMRAAGPPYADHTGQFLLFDPRDGGRIAEVFGDLATADRIAVLVPGAGDSGDNFWTGVGGRSYRSPAVQAANLYRSAAGYGPAAGRFAVIAWLGYQPPSGVDTAAAREDRAQAGAVALRRFLAGLLAVDPHATIALLGHSYGSTVVGVAAHLLPSQVTDIAVFGSPGMGVDNVAQLRTTARVWAGQSSQDWIRWIPGVRVLGLGHGTKPVDPSFGARIFGTGGVADHDHYLSPGTESLANLTRIAMFGTDREAVP